MSRSPAAVLVAGLILLSGRAGAAAPRGSGGAAWSPASEVLRTLGLEAVDFPEGGRTALVSLPPTGGAPLTAGGPALLRREMVDGSVLELESVEVLRAEDGRTIAVLPVVPPGARSNWPRMKAVFFDLSPFYFVPPSMADPERTERWRRFAARYVRDQEAIRAFIAERFSFLPDPAAAFGHRTLPYRLHEIDGSGRWTTYGFDPRVFLSTPAVGPEVCDLPAEEFLKVFASSPAGVDRAVIPNFPTVYSLGNLTPDELDYLRRMVVSPWPVRGSKVLVVGPGTGVDTWLASLRTTEPVRVVGINPLEVANTVTTARLAGFSVRAVVADNAVDEHGEPRFPGEAFDAVYWNMPAYWPERSADDLRSPLEQVWDGDVGGLVLKRFARALPRLLVPGGRALLWNQGVYRDGVNQVSEILKGGGGERLSVEVIRYPKPSRKAEGDWYPGELYVVTRPNGR